METREGETSVNSLQAGLHPKIRFVTELSSVPSVKLGRFDVRPFETDAKRSLLSSALQSGQSFDIAHFEATRTDREA
jgi:hypothetical protein